MKVTIVLDNIRSAWNVGSIFRSCDALGFEIILIGYTPRPVGNTLKLIAKTAIGAENSVKWHYFSHSQEVLQHYHEGEHMAIEISNTSKSIFDFLKSQEFEIEAEYFFWFGNEIHGLAPSLVAEMKTELHLPMVGKKESLNIANCVCTVGYLLNYQASF